MLSIRLNKTPILVINHEVRFEEIHSHICQYLNLMVKEYYLLQNGRIINHDSIIKNGNIDVELRTYGGKGGFGSMLRAIGAQIEKTTNREACRDLSGRRLRDINEEKRLKKWITQQSEREQEATQRKQKKLERLCETPKHEFKDKCYDNERTQLPEMVENAVVQGIKATCSNSSLKRKNTLQAEKTKKKAKLWIDADVDDLSSDDSDFSDDNGATSSNAPNSETSSSDEVHNHVQRTSNLLEMKEESVELSKNSIEFENTNKEAEENVEHIDGVCVNGGKEIKILQSTIDQEKLEN